MFTRRNILKSLFAIPFAPLLAKFKPAKACDCDGPTEIVVGSPYSGNFIAGGPINCGEMVYMQADGTVVRAQVTRITRTVEKCELHDKLSIAIDVKIVRI